MYYKKIWQDYEKLNLIYPHSNLEDDPSHKKWYNFLPKNIKVPLKKLRDKIFIKKPDSRNSYTPTDDDWKAIFKLRVDELTQVYNKEAGVFIYKKNQLNTK